MRSGVAGTGIPLHSVDHIAYLVKDLDKTRKFLSSVFGLGPWFVPFDYSPSKEELKYGEPFSMRASGTKIGAVELHLIQPLDKDSIWAQWIRTHGEGIHHIAFAPSKCSDIVSKLQKEPGITMMAGAGEFGKHWYYFSTDPGGMIMEFQDPGMHDPLYENLEL